jgi:polyphosphate kinase 2 (PPK2 family)
MKNAEQDSTPAGPMKIVVRGKEREFDIDDPKLPDWVENHKLTTGGYPYDKKMKREHYDATLEALQVELVKAQAWMQAAGHRVLALFEGGTPPARAAPSSPCANT